ncbi:hypothetical protein R5W24_000499 [Gemmata sp. JC717]|uniref:hypothetical protein n=1 Tax=Gemmata algarum TaxID=2975278 RepID=UPI0021BA99E4|nr:hypothetical protein [Gemmata algarum]MDY3551423.1 hypothetical protein [Gemmata algarum]
MTQKVQYAPGPYEAWPVKDDRLKRWLVVCVNPRRCPGTGKEVLAEKIRTQSQAQLFAASPRLVEALKASRAVLANILGTEMESRIIAEQVAIIDAALAEAEVAP